MDAVNIRELKRNPSEALRRAKKGPVVVLRRQVPQALLLDLDLERLPGAASVKRALATALFRDGALSLGGGARLAEMSLSGFASHLSRCGVPIVAGAPDEALEDLATLENWLGSS